MAAADFLRMHVKQFHPSFRIDGFDKSLEQCLPVKLYPEGCSIRQLDITDDVPADLHNVYDIVHVRLIQAGLGDDPIPALKNLITMLKTGGYLQWQELDLNAISVASADPNLGQASMGKVADWLHHGSMGQWTRRLADICSEHGLLDARTDKHHTSPRFSMRFCQNQFLVLDEISKVAMDNTGPDSEGPVFRGLIEKATAEMKAGVWLDNSLKVTIARKPD